MKEQKSPRSRRDFISGDDLEKIKKAFNDGRRSTHIANELRCSRRTVSRYYAIFRGTPQKLGRPKDVLAHRVKRPVPLQSRFYKSNFELEG